jgi:hypothetical protein
MKITITGKPKEIAALAVETQRRLTDLNLDLRIAREREDFTALKNGISLLRELRDESSDPATTVYP